jgi:hypothetical protein
MVLPGNPSWCSVLDMGMIRRAWLDHVLAATVVILAGRDIIDILKHRGFDTPAAVRSNLHTNIQTGRRLSDKLSDNGSRQGQSPAHASGELPQVRATLVQTVSRLIRKRSEVQVLLGPPA